MTPLGDLVPGFLCLTTVAFASGTTTQQPLFSIPFSGQPGLFAEDEEDDIFGAVAGHQPGLLGASRPSLGKEASFAFDDLSAQQDELQSQSTAQAFADHLSAEMQDGSTAGLYHASAFAQQYNGAQGPGWQNSMAEPAQQQVAGSGAYEAASAAVTMQAHGQLPDQDAALWPPQHAQPSTSLHAQTQSLFNPHLQAQSPSHPQLQAQSFQSHSQSLFQPSMQSRAQLPLQSQPQSQWYAGTQLQSQGQPLLQPPSQSLFQFQSQLQSQVRPSFQPVRPPLLSHGQQHLAPQVFRPGGTSQGLPSTSFGHSPSAAAAAPFQPAFQPALLPQSTPLLPFQAAFQSPTSFQSSLPSVPVQPAFRPPLPGPQAQSQPPLQLPGGPLLVSTQRVSSPFATDTRQHLQQKLPEDDFWASQDDGTAPPDYTGLSLAVSWT